MSQPAHLLQTMARFAGPLDPFTTLEQWEQRHAAWLDGLGSADVEPLLAILAALAPPYAGDDGFEGELQDALAAAGRAAPRELLGRLRDVARLAAARAVAIDVIGALGLESGVDVLRGLLEQAELNEDELVRLACSLGDIGGMAARELLAHMQTSAAVAMPDVAEEIDIALERIDKRSGKP